VRVNVDGALKRSTSQAECGGVIRDRWGKWLSGFVMYLGLVNAYRTLKLAKYNIFSQYLVAFRLTPSYHIYKQNTAI